MLEKIGKSIFAVGILFSLLAFAWDMISNESSKAASILEVAGCILILGGIIVYIISIIRFERPIHNRLRREKGLKQSGINPNSTLASIQQRIY